MAKVHATRRRYSGQEEAERVLFFLNGKDAESTAERERLADLWRNLTIWQESHGGPSHYRLFLPTASGNVYDDFEFATEADINGVLGELRLEPAFVGSSGRTGLEIVWRTQSDRKQKSPTEGPAVMALFELFKAGQVDLVRPCHKCGNWFFAKRNDAKFCSSECRTQFFRATEHGRELRRAYMRRYRRMKEARKSVKKQKKGGHK